MDFQTKTVQLLSGSRFLKDYQIINNTVARAALLWQKVAPAEVEMAYVLRPDSPAALGHSRAGWAKPIGARSWQPAAWRKQLLPVLKQRCQ